MYKKNLMRMEHMIHDLDPQEKLFILQRKYFKKSHTNHISLD
jgi:hypothetical protein